jgi:hypothetical protein
MAYYNYYHERFSMKLRFEVDQAECLRHGIDCPKSIVTIDIRPQDLTEEDRNIIADAMIGIDVCIVVPDGKEKVEPMVLGVYAENGKPVPKRVIANEPTLKGLIEAVRKNRQEVLK